MADRVCGRAAWEDRGVRTPAEALAALRALPCGARLLGVLAEHDGAWVVGGAVRDALLGATPRELDVVVEGDPEPVARALGEIVAFHERFGTYDVVDGDCLYDVVTARRESYRAPGALPDVVPAGLEDDLSRRDFTVNALALSAAGELHAAPAALEDLEAGRLRILHAPYGFTAGERRILDRAAAIEPVAPAPPARPSEVAAALRGEPVEAVAVAGARGDAQTARAYWDRWRDVALEIDGHDLIDAGVPEGPELGRLLAAVLARRLDGDLAPGREAELAAALDAAS
jgi:tRNA nucleotidyltransferase/poly(A) polymerase